MGGPWLDSEQKKKEGMSHAASVAGLWGWGVYLAEPGQVNVVVFRLLVCTLAQSFEVGLIPSSGGRR